MHYMDTYLHINPEGILGVDGKLKQFHTQGRRLRLMGIKKSAHLAEIL